MKLAYQNKEGTKKKEENVTMIRNTMKRWMLWISMRRRIREIVVRRGRRRMNAMNFMITIEKRISKE